MTYETILYEKKGRIVYITLNRTEVLNALNDTMAKELNEAFREFDVDEEAWVAILSGKGRCFGAGADVRQRQLRPPEDLKRRGGPGGVRNTPDVIGLGATINWKPVIAAVHNYVFGAAFAMAMECDIVVASEDAKFEITEVHRGVGGAQHWLTAWYWGGAKWATEMVATGRRLTAQEALARGMVNHVVAADKLLAEAEKIAQDIIKLPPLSVRCNIRVSRWSVRELQRQAVMYQQALKLYLTEDYQESTRSFVEKRQPTYKGK